MNFKSYTRKSSANTGAERAGYSADSVVQHEGKWGFWIKDEPVQVEEEVAPVIVTVKKISRTTERRKAKRRWYRALRDAARYMSPDAKKSSFYSRHIAEIRAHIYRLRNNRHLDTLS